MKLSLSGKIIRLILISVVIVSLSILGVIFYTTCKEFDKRSQTEVLTAANAVQVFLENFEEKAVGFAHITAQVRCDSCFRE